MKFNESEFRELADETRKTIVALGATKSPILHYYQEFTEIFVSYLKNRNIPFDRELCLMRVDRMCRFPKTSQSSRLIEWRLLRRFVNLIAEQKAGTLTEWRRYSHRKIDMPANEEFVDVLSLFKEFLLKFGFKEATAKRYAASARRFLIYLEKHSVLSTADIKNTNIAEYFASPRFNDRLPKGVKTEASELKKFLIFLKDNKLSSQEYLQLAVPRYSVPINRIITTLTPETVSDIMADKPNCRVNKRDIAVCLLALHVGLRWCDIRNLKFCDINWDNKTIAIKQSKTGAALKMPLDNETQNAIIDYLLNERRECDLEYVFITGIGPKKALKTPCYFLRHRISPENIPRDGIHILRRTFASTLLQCGTPLETISYMLGHVDKNVVQCYLSTEELKMKRCALSLSAIPYKGWIFDV